MNRRELAKKGFMAACGFLCAKLPEAVAKSIENGSLTLSFSSSDAEQATTVKYFVSGPDGNWRKMPAEWVHDI